MSNATLIAMSLLLQSPFIVTFRGVPILSILEFVRDAQR